VAPAPSAWVAHETLVLLIICELVDNAIDALDRVGTIGVAVSELGSVGLVQIVVRDSGQGIPSHIKDRIYSPGVSTKGDGRGFGLSLVAEAVGGSRGKLSTPSIMVRSSVWRSRTTHERTIARSDHLSNSTESSEVQAAC